MVKILLVKLKNLYIQYAWIWIMKKQNSKVEKMVVFVQILIITIPSLILVTFRAAQKNCKRTWNWNLDRNLIMALLIMAIYTVLLEKQLYTILK